MREFARALAQLKPFEGSSVVSQLYSTPFDAELIAHMLWAVIVVDSGNPLDPLREEPEFAEACVSPRYLARVELYKCALVVHCLEHANHKGERHDEVQEAFERLLFSEGPDLALLQEINEARREVGDLLEQINNKTRRELRWSLKWLDSIGIENQNPVALMIVAHYWFTYWLEVATAVEGDSPHWK